MTRIDCVLALILKGQDSTIIPRIIEVDADGSFGNGYDPLHRNRSSKSNVQHVGASNEASPKSRFNPLVKALPCLNSNWTSQLPNWSRRIGLTINGLPFQSM